MQAEALTVTELTKSVKYLLESNFSRICVLGEISSLARPSSGHLYFNLKDESSQVSGVMFRSSAQRCKFELENGLEVFLYGRLSVYEPRGTYQIIVDRVEPFGLGALQLAFEQLKERLEEEGLFDEEHKQPIPYLPSAIGIVTSPTGAAIQDILNILERRFAEIPVVINPVSVQGETASREIAQAIKQFNRLKNVDVMIVGRGGGSLEDLWAFNEEPVARAIYNSRIPVISAVGHETDFCISDFVADLRAPTPSAAAELVVPLREDLEYRLEDARSELISLVTRKLDQEKERVAYFAKRLRSPDTVIQTYMMKADEYVMRLKRNLEKKVLLHGNRLDNLMQRLVGESPAIRIDKYGNQLNELQLRMKNALLHNLTSRKNRLTELVHVLDTVSPLSTMTRGYSVLTGSAGRLISTVKQVREKSRLNIRLSDGTIKAVSEKIIPNESENEELNNGEEYRTKK